MPSFHEQKRRPAGSRRTGIFGAASPSYWLPHLDGIEAVVNCAGVLQDGPNDSTSMAQSTPPSLEPQMEPEVDGGMCEVG
jgi:hypothetical protein